MNKKSRELKQGQRRKKQEDAHSLSPHLISCYYTCDSSPIFVLLINRLKENIGYLTRSQAWTLPLARDGREEKWRMCEGVWFATYMYCVGDEETMSTFFMQNLSTLSYKIMSDKIMNKKAGAKSCLFIFDKNLGVRRVILRWYI